MANVPYAVPKSVGHRLLVILPERSWEHLWRLCEGTSLTLAEQVSRVVGLYLNERVALDVALAEREARRVREAATLNNNAS